MVVDRLSVFKIPIGSCSEGMLKNGGINGSCGCVSVGRARGKLQLSRSCLLGVGHISMSAAEGKEKGTRVMKPTV